jgi:hypothetical protein
MRFTEHEMTVAVRAAAQTVASGRRKRASWDQMDAMQRYHVLDAVGGQVLPVLLALPDVEVEAGTRPTFTTAQVAAAVEQTMAEGGGRLRRKAAVAARTALVLQALAALPVRHDPDALTSPDDS